MEGERQMKLTEKTQFATYLPDELIDQIRIESLRRGVPIHEYMTETLEHVVPKVRIVGGGEPHRARSLKS